MRSNQISLANFCDMIRDLKTPDAELESILAAHPDLLKSYEPLYNKRTPLHIVFCYGRSRKLIELLIRRNPDNLSIADIFGQLPLYYLCRYHRKYCAEELLMILELMVETCPTSLQVHDMYNYTPLHSACQSNAPFPVIAYLTKLYPQSLQIKEHNCDRTPFYLACENVTDLSTIKLLYTSYPLAARWRNKHGMTPFWEVCGCRNAIPDIIKYLIFEICPLDCFSQHGLDICHGPEVEACVEEVTKEVISALVDVAFHIKHILPDRVIQEIAENVLHFHTTCDTTHVTAGLSADRNSGFVLDESARMNFDDLTIRAVLKSKELQDVLQNDKDWGNVHVLLDSVIRMNRAGRLYFIKDPNNKVKGIKVLQAASGLDALFFHLRENPSMSKQA